MNERRLCKKFRYKTQAGAIQAVREITAKETYTPPPDEILNAYECNRCGGWHVGHGLTEGEMAAIIESAQRAAGTFHRNQRIYRMFCQGVDVQEIAQQYGMNPTTIREIVRNASVVARSKGAEE